MSLDSSDQGGAQESKSRERPSTLLLVDDEKNILSSLRRLFRPDGYEVLTAESGAEALDMMKEYQIDLVLSDMRMPEMDGAQLLAAVARDWPETIRMLLTGYADLESTVAAINKGHIYGYFSKPWDDNEIRLSIRHALERKQLEQEKRRLLRLTQKQNRELQDLNANLEQKVQARTEELNQTNQFLELAYQQLKESYYNAIPIFAHLVQLREGQAGGHSSRVGELARDVAERMELEEEEAQHVYFAALLHDIGNLALPDDIVETPYYRLDGKMKKTMEQHPAIGASVLMGLEPLHRTALFIRQHHESLDGEGYPDGLKGDQIALGSRIVMACNEYDGLRHGWLQGDDLSSADAMDYMRKRAGHRYDSDVLDALFAIVRERDSGQGSVREHRLEPMALQPGMLLSRDLISPQGVLMLTRDHRLDEVLIEKIQGYEQDAGSGLVVHVYASGES